MSNADQAKQATTPGQPLRPSFMVATSRLDGSAPTNPVSPSARLHASLFDRLAASFCRC
jgi:hypothetical protein